MTGEAYAYPRFFAHRGGGALAPENTLAGFALAARLDYRAVEFDVRLCADGTPVLMHDETLERTTNGSGAVARTPLATLARLDAGAKHHRAFAGLAIPTLEEALARCAKLGLAANIEIKPAAGHERQTGAVVAAVAARCAQEMQTALPLLSSFSPAALIAAGEAAAELPRALLVEAVPPDWREQLERLGCVGLHCASRHLTPAAADALLAAGVPYACYTVNRREEAARLFARGAQAVFTDRLDLFEPATAFSIAS